MTALYVEAVCILFAFRNHIRYRSMNCQGIVLMKTQLVHTSSKVFS